MDAKCAVRPLHILVHLLDSLAVVLRSRRLRLAPGDQTPLDMADATLDQALVTQRLQAIASRQEAVRQLEKVERFRPWNALSGGNPFGKAAMTL